VEGSRFVGGCQTTGNGFCQSNPEPARYRCSPPDSGVVPFSEARNHQLRVEALPLAASNRRSKAALAFIFPYTSWGENDDNATCLRD